MEDDLVTWSKISEAYAEDARLLRDSITLFHEQLEKQGMVTEEAQMLVRKFKFVSAQLSLIETTLSHDF